MPENDNSFVPQLFSRIANALGTVDLLSGGFYGRLVDQYAREVAKKSVNSRLARRLCRDICSNLWIVDEHISYHLTISV